jgi:DNA-binding response OmpR family regulator
MAAHRILVVDDEAPLLRLISNYVSRAGYEVTCCGSASEVRTLAETEDWDAAIVDLSLPDSTGAGLLLFLLDRFPHLRLLASSGGPFDAGTLGEAYRGRTAFLAKPYLPGDLIAALEALTTRRTPPAK